VQQMNNKCTYNFSSSNYKQTKKNIASDSILFSYKSSSYVNLKNYFEENIQTISEELKSKIDLKWINVTISNLKAFKLNRRNYTNKFDNLLLNLI